jgi:hypothetical protein
LTGQTVTPLDGLPARDTPELSVVIAPVSRGEFLAAALERLREQVDAPRLEVIVPVDYSVAGVEELESRFPEARFLPVEGTAELGLSDEPGIAHLAIDRRRAVALAAATAPIVALTDEWTQPQVDWCAQLVRAHALPHAVIGGAVTCGRQRAVNWALFFMDAGRYQNPLPEGPAEFVTDVNVSYKRHILEQSDVWRFEYHETQLHDELRSRGETLWLSPDIVVAVDRGWLRLGAALRERFAWSRLYAGRRAHEVGAARRALLTIGSPLLSILLLLRQCRLAWRRGQHRAELVRCLPILALMDLVWSVGECTGYLTGRGTSTAPARAPA